MKWMSLAYAAALLVASCVVLSFQNCGNSGFNSFSPSSKNPTSATQDTSQNQDIAAAEAARTTSLIPTLTNDTLSDTTDNQTPNCTDSVLAGWKCLAETVETAEGQKFKVLIKWSRPLLKSKGSVLQAVGGAGMGESRSDPPSKLIMDRLSDSDQLRVIELEFMDPSPRTTDTWGGYFVHGGGYKSAGHAFAAAVKLMIDRHIIRGQFLNYLGGSNGSAVAAYSMSHLNIDKYFDRVVFQMGPFLSSYITACNPNSPASVYASNPDQSAMTVSLLNIWRFGDANHNFCNDSQAEDRISILGAKKSFPTTHVHVIIGDLEEAYGFGRWIRNSNSEWFAAITAKSKSFLVRPGMAHNNSYPDMRRFLKLTPTQTPTDDVDCVDQVGEFCNGANIVKWNIRGCLQYLPPTVDPNIKWVQVAEGAFHLATDVTCQN